MNCEHIRESFSDLYDGALSAAAGAPLRQHLAACAVCRRDYETFEQATTALRAAALPPASEAVVASVLDRVAADRTPAPLPAVRTRRLRAVASHLATALAGAAAVLAVLALRGDAGTARNDLDPVSTAAAARQGIRLRFADQQGRIRRGGEEEWVAGTVTFYPGDEIEVLDDAEVVERVVKVPEVRFVEQRAPWHGLDLTGVDMHGYGVALVSTLEQVRSSWQRVRRGFGGSPMTLHVFDPAPDHPGSRPSGPQPPRHAPVVSAPDARPGSDPAPTPPARPAPDAAGAPLPRRTAPPVAFAPPPVPDPDLAAEPVVLRRTEGQIGLSVRGPVLDVVPRLLPLLRDSDPGVVQLVEQQLTRIRDDLARDPALRRAFEESDASLRPKVEDSPLLRALFGTDEPDAPPPTAAERWTHWWERNAVMLLARGVDDTF